MNSINSLDYERDRQAFLRAEAELMTGGHTHLSTQEVKADEIFMKYKLKELVQGFKNPEQNAAA